MTPANPQLELLVDLWKETQAEIKELSAKVDSYHKETTERIHTLDKKVENHDKTFGALKWLGGLSLGAGGLSFLKDWFGVLTGTK